MVEAIIIPFPKQVIMAKFRGAVLACAECGSEFRVPPTRANTARYCSKRCADPNRQAMRRKERVVLKCEGCGKPFEEHACHASRRKYCSRTCSSKAWASETVGHRKSVKWAKRPGLTLHADGYVLEWVPDHPFASGGYVFQHRLVMERWLRVNDPESRFLNKLGNQLYLSPEFEVHHRDEDKRHNQIDNLECFVKGEHSRLHNDKRRAAATLKRAAAAA